MANVVTPWPPVTFEERPWTSAAGYVSRTQQRRHAGPYLAAVLPEIAGAAVSLPPALTAEAEEAAQELVRFDTSISNTLGAAAQLGPMSAVLLRTESAASSQIENLTVGARQLALAELGEHSNRNARIVTGNVRSMEAALALSEVVDEGTVLAMHRALMEDSDPENAGRWRTEQVWIGGSNIGPHRAAFVPPHHEHVSRAMKDLIAFADRDDVPSIAHTAIVHAQFETIHPFTDGNGRTGRALVHAMLSNRRLTERVTVPISAGLLTNTADYFGALDHFRQGDVEPIVRQFVDAVFFAIGSGRRLVDDLRAVRDSFNDRLTARRDSVAWRIADAVIGQPVINNSYVTSQFGVTDVAAQRAIDRLVECGVLRSGAQRARNRVWQADDVLRALDDFAARIRRVPPSA
ncbi:Fic family protein [Antrihabitans sp. YC3-6]|uniref:Fic family protein n=1 Tax=Antrihabitans stalagmiti TaxID=2799499 RepID=A0A934NTM1_9NOCA|nr:Fic family protein [Antrihabitans stalagmiti]MBJ8341063.1 Fic family protein [Antrihabitans stalagmiti]